MIERAKRQQRDKGDDNSVARPKRRRKKPLKVPPPDCTVWPEQYRREHWKSVYAILFARRCQLCAYSCPLPKSRQLLNRIHGQTRLLLCTNHPSFPGELCEVLPIETCRNFKKTRWQPPCSRPTEDRRHPTADECDPQVRGGTSQFTGVSRHRNKWVAYVTRRGKYYYVGIFDDEVEATKARDRKAYELHGEYAYLNFPEDFDR